MKLVFLISLIIFNFNNFLLGQDSTLKISIKNNYLNKVEVKGINLIYDSSIFKKLIFEEINFNYVQKNFEIKNCLNINFLENYFEINIFDSITYSNFPYKLYYKMDSTFKTNCFVHKSFVFNYYYEQNRLKKVEIRYNGKKMRFYFSSFGIESIAVEKTVDSILCIIYIDNILEKSYNLEEIILHNYQDSSYLTFNNRKKDINNYVKEIYGFDISTTKENFYINLFFNKKGRLKRKYRKKSNYYFNW